MPGEHVTGNVTRTQNAVPPTTSEENFTRQRSVPNNPKPKSRPKPPPLMDWIDKLPDEQTNLNMKNANKVTDEYAEVIFPTGHDSFARDPHQAQHKRSNTKNKEKGAYTIFVEKTNQQR
ncbi:hypothetical protein ACO0QE_001047 [Hanseniaspora vineae]